MSRDAFPNGDPFLGRLLRAYATTTGHGGTLWSFTPLLMATGPLTNVAMMPRLRPEKRSQWSWAGCAHATGIASASAEFVRRKQRNLTGNACII